MIFASACFAAYVWATYWVPETANVSLEDIDTLFGSTAGQEDLRIKHQVRIALSVSLGENISCDGTLFGRPSIAQLVRDSCRFYYLHRSNVSSDCMTLFKSLLAGMI